MRHRGRRRPVEPASALAVGLACLASVLAGLRIVVDVDLVVGSPAASTVSWMHGLRRLGDPGPVRQGRRAEGRSEHSAKNVLVLEPGTSAGSAYFVPLAKWIVSKLPDWQVWSVERRENLLEDQSELNLYKQGKVTSTQLFDYYLGYLTDKSITHHFQIDPRLVGRVREGLGHERRGAGPPRRDRCRVEDSAAKSCSVATRSAVRWSPRTPPGTSTVIRAPTISPGSSTTTGGAARR